jgi:hypothetical protein
MKQFTKEEIKSKNLPLASKFFDVDLAGLEPASPFAKDGILPHELQAQVHGIIIKQKKSFIQELPLLSKQVARKFIRTPSCNSIISPTNTMSIALFTSIII